MSSEFPQTDRDRALEAMSVILESIPGVRKCFRHGGGIDQVPESQIPAIFIFEGEAEQTLKLHAPPRGFVWRFPVTLLFEAKARKTAAAPEGNVSTVRDAFAHVIISKLLENPTLNVQLDDEDAAQDHVYACAPEQTFEIEFFDDVPFPAASGRVTFDVLLPETIDSRVFETWEQVILSVADEPDFDDESARETTITLEDPINVGIAP